MVDITVADTEGLVVGTAGDDTTTFDGDIAVTDNALIGAPPGEAGNGGGGSDTAILTDANNTLVALDLAGGVVFDDDGAPDGGGLWFLGGVAAGAGVGQLWNGFTSVTFADDVTLEGGVASMGVTAPNVAGGLPAADGSYAADPASASAYEWDGAALTIIDLTGASVVSVNGNAASVGTSFTDANGAISVVDNAGVDEVEFTPNTALLAGSLSVGEPVEFVYDVVLDLAGVLYTVSQVYEIIVNFTAGNDTWDAAIDEDGNVVAPNAGAPTPGAGVDGGDDTFLGDDRANDIAASTGNDTLLGANGDDILNGGDGDDFIRGGNGDDNITAASGGATDVGNNLGGGAGTDVINGGDGDDTLFGGVGDDNTGGLNGGNGDDVINGGAGDDVLNGGDDADLLRGGDGDDELNGDAGNDELRGGAGVDTVNGGVGDDEINTSLGGDELTGGDGEDTFVLKAGTGNTTITDFDAPGGDDKMDVSALGFTSLADVLEIAYETSDDVAASQVVIVIDADTSVTLQDTTIASLTVSDFDFA